MGKVERRRSSRLKAESDWPSADGGWRQWNSELGMRNAEKKRKSEAVGKEVEKLRR
jgi:hypothetical protein